MLYSQVIIVEKTHVLPVVAAFANWGWANLETLTYRYRDPGDLNLYDAHVPSNHINFTRNKTPFYAEEYI